MRSKKELAVTLSKLKVFEKPNFRLEQYPTDSDAAASIIWHASLSGDIGSKTIADLGCGTGILGIGTMFFSPKKVYFVDVDKYALKRLEENLSLFDFSGFDIVNSDVSQFSQQVDVVFQNPPFGSKNRHADRKFLDTAFNIAQVVYSFHIFETLDFVKKYSLEKGFRHTHIFKFSMPLKQTYSYHKKKIHRIEVCCLRLEKLNNTASNL